MAESGTCGTPRATVGSGRSNAGRRRKALLELTHEDISQIWAEVLVLVENGEKLHLAPDLETLAKSEQREALESDEREAGARVSGNSAP